MLCCPRCKDEPFPRIVVANASRLYEMGERIANHIETDTEYKFRCNNCELEVLRSFKIWGIRTLKRRNNDRRAV